MNISFETYNTTLVFKRVEPYGRTDQVRVKVATRKETDGETVEHSLELDADQVRRLVAALPTLVDD